MPVINKIENEIDYETSMFKRNTNNLNNNGEEKSACCIVIPFGINNFNKSKQIDYCREDNLKWSFDEIIIEEKDMKWLIEKSNKLKILAGL